MPMLDLSRPAPIRVEREKKKEHPVIGRYL